MHWRGAPPGSHSALMTHLIEALSSQDSRPLSASKHLLNAFACTPLAATVTTALHKGPHRSSCIHGTTYLHHTLLTVTDE
jgi:hypothetical protein